MSTEKRFVLQDLDILCRVLDNGKPINGIETVHLLNTFYEENEQLKEDNMLLMVDSEKYRKLSIQFDNLNKELISENEKLKQQRDFYYARLQKIIKVANGDV